MNYQKIYDDICKRGQERILPEDVYTEKHHIIPKCLGGTNEKSNLTVLTAREHFLVHYILAAKIHKNHKGLWNAFRKMIYSKSKGQERYIPNGRFYEMIRHESSLANCGTGNNFYGKQHTEETKKYLSEIRIGKYCGENSPNFGKSMPQNVKDKISKSNKGKKRSPEICEEISLRMQGELNHFFGKTHTEETIAIIKEKRALQVFSEETREKQSKRMTGEGNHFFGKHHSEESRQKIKNNRPNARKCLVNDIEFNSIKSVADYHNLTVRVATNRLYSQNPKWETWKFLEENKVSSETRIEII